MNKKIIIFIVIIIVFLSGFFIYSKTNIKKEVNISDVMSVVRYTGDIKQCDEIINEEYKKRCISIGETADVFREVMTDGTAEGCNQLDDKFLRDGCIKSANAKEYRLEAILTGNAVLCNKIDDLNTKRMCLQKVNLFQKIVNEGDADKCVEFLNNDLVSECKKTVLGTK